MVWRFLGETEPEVYSELGIDEHLIELEATCQLLRLFYVACPTTYYQLPPQLFG